MKFHSRVLGLEVVKLSLSKVIKSGGSVRCDTLLVESDSWMWQILEIAY